MTGRTHDVAAATALTAVLLFGPLRTVTLATALIAVLANQLGGIAPDIDQPTAPLWRNLPVGGVIGKGFDKLLGGHRFITHSLIGLALFGFLCHLLLVFLHPIMRNVNIGYVWWAFMIGMLSHLIMDTLTKEGVPWLLPIPVKFGVPPIKKLRVTTGKSVEKFIVLPTLILLDVGLCTSHYDKLLALVHSYIV
jgi:membrane-bound metal-dependent hydrolase YbcI (DUF457 family)